MPDWLQQYVPEGWSETQLVLVVVVFSVATALLSILVSGWIVVRLPADYFVGEQPRDSWAKRHPLVRWPLVVGKNLFGGFLVLLGIIMSLPGVPGQGILTILIGAMLIDFPGKRACERWLLRRRGVLNGINKLRLRAGRPPLQLDSLPVNP